MDEERELAVFISGMLIGRGALGVTGEEVEEAWHLYKNNLPGNPLRRDDTTTEEEVMVWPDREEVTAWPYWKYLHLNVWN